jgi:hypothetical protein
MAVVTFSRATRVRIDLNVRARHGLVRAGFEDANGPLSVGDEVVVFEPEDGIEGLARVQELDETERFVYLDVDWSTFIEEPSEEQADGGNFSYVANSSETFALKEVYGTTSSTRSGSFARHLLWPQVHYALFAPSSDPSWTILPRDALTVVYSYFEIAPVVPIVTAYVDYGASEEGPQRDTSALVRST